METKIQIQLPLKRVPAPKRDQWYSFLPWRVRWFEWLIALHLFRINEFGGSRTNTRYHLQLFRRIVLTIHRNEYHDQSDKERADEYLAKWSECEKELRGLRLLQMGDATCLEVKKVIRESLGVDLNEGTIL